MGMLWASGFCAGLAFGCFMDKDYVPAWFCVGLAVLDLFAAYLILR